MIFEIDFYSRGYFKPSSKRPSYFEQVWEPWWHFKERSNSWSHMLGTQIPFIQGFGASNFHIWHWNLGGNLKKILLEGFWQGLEDAYFVSCQSAFFDNLSYFVDQIWRKITIDFQQWLAHLSPSWLVNKVASLSRRMAKHGFKS
jgi:hypothetical protein